MPSITIRRGTEADLPRVHALIVELAVYERAPDEVTNTLADMRRDGFGPEPIFGFFVAEAAEQGILGIALFYTAYSTWKGRMLFLEDLVVTEAARGTGLGRKLFDAVVAEARRTGAHRMKWQVLDWNEPAIGFYKKLGANLDPEWLNGNLTAEQLQAYPCDPAAVAAVG
ncbi:L-amino acid N-acyltransferase YncA [Hymenobacter daecheongensis DSM 21074]|uniref:L-amino acid N-acyltransferase YncA n=1 Tax=Hymenobacter daecheongensis DSM 21074 TaxID=1121955 RepID=A0A1M6AED0_9BACT|nr:GNAT family N-acetyltransferase [Hymenobacter daecheongensis]SHI34563.1 L-amino acid N-acyltransferase YncA [Hymenobacter daecheongensis DSM 21074]